MTKGLFLLLFVALSWAEEGTESGDAILAREAVIALLRAANSDDSEKFNNNVTGKLAKTTWLKDVVKESFGESRVLKVTIKGDDAVVRIDKAKDMLSPATAECDLFLIRVNGAWKLKDWKVDTGTAK